uniref:ABC transporter domain-containing protein n=1 Tax=Acrobeloides nanus TaxID=290746 RepID=A0A914DQT4_9BILA
MELSWHGVYVKPKHKNESGNIFSRIKNFAHQKIGEKKSEIHREHILQNAYGVAQPGEILALMGASGAGKTTLLNYLTQRNIHDVEASGTIRINGEVVKKQLLRKVSAYVQQEDLFIGSMTVLEHLRFMAVLRMGRTHKKNERERRVRMVMADLGLTGAANTVIGVFGKRGLSGGERKRLAFASEIMTSPPLLFCDEPTSGLDSFLAKQVVQVLKTLARRKGMTIVFTIHQPSSQVFEMFDKVLFMAEGRVAFLGDISQATEMWNKWGEPVPEQFNPADHFISSLAMQIGKEKKSLVRINKYCDEFAQSELGKSYMNEAGNGFRRGSFSSSLSSGSEEMLAKAKNSQRYKATWFQQYTALTKRSLISILREPMLLKVRIFQTF